MKSERDEMNQTDAAVSPSKFPLDRRELMKLGAGAAVWAALPAASASAQDRAGATPSPAPEGPAPHSMRSAGEISPFTGPGYKNTANRLGGNGPMDDTTRKVVKFVHEFSAAKMTPAGTHAFNRTMIDSMASLVAGFEEEPCRKIGRAPSELQSRLLISYAVFCLDRKSVV